MCNINPSSVSAQLAESIILFRLKIMLTRTIRAACPHDCPDTCAMLVTVEGDKAVEIKGDPDHPNTA
jgi:anaerobic selenocysteine-containing dehydrogenase